jgi:hypothetical protein
MCMWTSPLGPRLTSVGLPRLFEKVHQVCEGQLPAKSKRGSSLHILYILSAVWPMVFRNNTTKQTKGATLRASYQLLVILGQSPIIEEFGQLSQVVSEKKLKKTNKKYCGRFGLKPCGQCPGFQNHRPRHHERPGVAAGVRPSRMAFRSSGLGTRNVGRGCLRCLCNGCRRLLGTGRGHSPGPFAGRGIGSAVIKDAVFHEGRKQQQQ